MSKVRPMIPKAESIVKRIDPEAIVESSFYDDVSNRLFLTVVKGQKEIRITLPGYYFNDGGVDKIARAIEEGMSKLQRQPTS